MGIISTHKHSVFLWLTWWECLVTKSSPKHWEVVTYLFFNATDTFSIVHFLPVTQMKLLQKQQYVQSYNSRFMFSERSSLQREYTNNIVLEKAWCLEHSIKMCFQYILASSFTTHFSQLSPHKYQNCRDASGRMQKPEKYICYWCG